MQLLPLHGWTSALPLLLLLQSSASTTRTATPSSPSSWDLQQQQVSDCPSCVLARLRRGEVQGELEEEQAVVVEAVKKHILDALQLQSRPNVTRPLPHAALNNVLRRLHMVGEGGEGERTWGVWGGGDGGGGGAAGVAGGAGGDREATEIITFAEAGESPAELHFLLSAGGVRGEVNEPWVVEQAHVWLFLRLVKSNRNSSRCISSSSSRPIRNSSSSRCGSSSLSSSSSNSSSSSKVHLRVTVHLSSLPQGTPLGEKTVEVRRSSWHSFPLAVRGLLLHAAPLRLRVSCPLCAQAGVTPVLISSPTTITSASRGQQQLQQSHQPFLSAVVRPGRGDAAEGEQRSRSRRGAAEECEEGRRRQRGCCRRSLYVAFKDIGWSDWIIAPPGYQAHYCQGQCSLVGAAGAAGGAGSFHGAVLAHLRLRGSGPPGGLRSCCVPTRLRPLSLLYYDQEQNIIKRDVQDLVVEECGCS